MHLHAMLKMGSPGEGGRLTWAQHQASQCIAAWSRCVQDDERFGSFCLGAFVYCLVCCSPSLTQHLVPVNVASEPCMQQKALGDMRWE